MPTSPDEFAVTAQQAVENAPDVDTGYQWLAQEYSSQEWSEPERAKNLLTEYGTTLRQKFSKNNIAGLGDVSRDLPYSRDTLPDANLPDEEARRIEKENLWEKANLASLQVTDDPQLLLKKDLLEKYIPAAATLERRRIKDPGFFEDAAARVALGVISPVTSLLGTGNPQALTEATNPERDDDFLSEVIGGAGTVGAAIGLGVATGGAAPLAYLGAGAAGSVKETYQDTKETTGSTGRAVAAAAVDAAGQSAGFILGGKVAGKVSSKIAQAMLASNQVLAEGGTQAAAKSVFRQIMGTAGEQAAANVAMTQGRLSAQRVGETGEASAAIPTGQDVATDVRAAAVGGVLGAGAGAFGAGYEELAQRRAARAEARRAATPEAQPAEQAPISDEEALATLSDPDALEQLALDQTAATLPKIDSDGVAHTQEEQTLLQQPTTEDQTRAPEDATQTFTGANGDTFHVYEDGHTTQTKADTGQLAPADKMLYVNKNMAAILQGLKLAKTADGETPKLAWDGENLIVKSDYVTQDLDIADTPTGSRFQVVETKDQPEVGDVPVAVSGPLTGGEKTRYSSNIGPTITDIQMKEIPPLEEIQPEGPGTKPRMTDQRIVENERLPQSVRDAFSTTNAKGEKETTFRYVEQPMADTRNEGAMWIEKVGGDMMAANKFLSGPDQVSREVAAGVLQLNKRLVRGIANAQKAGDPIAALKLNELLGNIRGKFARGNTERGQIINQLKDLQIIDPREAVAFKVNELRSDLLKQELAKEGITPDEAAEQNADIQRIGDRITELESTAAKNPSGEQSPEQAREITRLQRQRDQLKTKTDNRIARTEKKLESKFPEADREKYGKLYAARSEFPDGSPDQKAVDAELNTIERKLSRSRGGRLLDAWRSYYILNLLADVGTGIATAVGNTANLGIGSAAAVAGGVFREGGHLADIPQNFEQFSRIAVKSFPKAFRNAFADFMGGYFAKYEEGDFVRNGPPGLRYLGYVGRFLSALDTFSSELGTDAATAIRLMEEVPNLRELKGEELRSAIDEQLYGTHAFREQAAQEARQRVERLKELGIKGDERVIMDDIFKRQRPEHIQEELEKWGRKIALRTDPGGSIGFVGDALNKLRKVPFAGPAFINFVRAAGNLIAFKVELTPYGLIRPTLLEKFHGEKLTPLEKSQMYTSAIVGSVIAAGAYGLMKSGSAQIHGNGPSNPSEKKRLMDSGWKPFSIQVGDKFISYAELPFSTILAGVGGYGDYQKYSVAKNKISEGDAANYIMGASFSSLFANPLTQNAAEFIEILKQGNEGGDIVGRLENFAKRNIAEAGKNAIIPGNRTLRNVAAMFQDPLETRLSWQAAILNGTPWVGSSSAGAGKPALNLFGEPIYAGRSASERYRSISRFYSQQVTDPALRFLTDKGYYITDLPGNVTIPDQGYRATKQQRTGALGAEYEDVLTQSERYELQRLSGPEIKRTVEQFRAQYSYGPWNEKVQKKLSEDVSQIRQKYKRIILSRGAARGFKGEE